MTVSVDFDGQIVKAENLLRLSDAQKQTGISRQSLLLWSRGEGRGKNEPLKLLHLFGGLPHLDKEYFEGWLKRTQADGNQTNERAAARRLAAAAGKYADVDEREVVDVLKALMGPEGKALRKLLSMAPVED